MANKRTWKKRHDKELLVEVNKLKSYVDEIKKMNQILEASNELYLKMYKEYNAFKDEQKAEKKKECELIKRLASLRDTMCRQMRILKENEWQNKQKITMLENYIFQIENHLHEEGVEIIEGNEFENYDKNLMQVMKRVDVPNPMFDNKVAKVDGSAYIWNGTVISRMKVSVYRCLD